MKFLIAKKKIHQRSLYIITDSEHILELTYLLHSKLAVRTILKSGHAAAVRHSLLPSVPQKLLIEGMVIFPIDNSSDIGLYINTI